MYPSAVVLTMSWRLIRHWNRFRHNLHGMMLRTSASIITVRHWIVLILRGLTLLKTDMNPILPKKSTLDCPTFKMRKAMRPMFMTGALRLQAYFIVTNQERLNIRLLLVQSMERFRSNVSTKSKTAPSTTFLILTSISWTTCCVKHSLTMLLHK